MLLLGVCLRQKSDPLDFGSHRSGNLTLLQEAENDWCFLKTCSLYKFLIYNMP
jgi:hypothetical protein